MSEPIGVLSQRLEWSVFLAGVALAGGMLGLVHDAVTITALTTLAIGGLAVWIAWQDIKLFKISDAAVLSIAVLAFATRWDLGRAADLPIEQTLLAIGIDVALSGGALLLFREIYYRRKGYDGIGFGDVKLAAAGGMLVGALGFSWALFAASLIGLIFVFYRRLAQNPLDGRGKIAFGAVLAPALWGVWIAQQMPFLLIAIGR